MDLPKAVAAAAPALTVLRALARRPAPAALVLLVLAAALLGKSGWHWLSYDRGAIMHGQLWRLITAHLVHLSATHAALNIAAVLLLAALQPAAMSTRDWLIAGFFSSLAVGVGLLVASPEVVWYVGLSGTLHGLYAWAALAHVRAGDRLGIALLALLGMKIVSEQVFGATPGMSALVGGDVITAAHLYGAAGGIAASLFNARVVRRASGAVSRAATRQPTV